MLDKVGRLFLIGPSNHNLAKLENVDLNFFPLSLLRPEHRHGGRGSLDIIASGSSSSLAGGVLAKGAGLEERHPCAQGACRKEPAGQVLSHL